MAKELGSRRITSKVVALGAPAIQFRGDMVRDNPEVNRQVAAMTPRSRARRAGSRFCCHVESRPAVRNAPALADRRVDNAGTSCR